MTYIDTIHFSFIKVPTQITQASGSKDFDLKVSGTGGLSFTDTKKVTFDQKSASVFIQTDKAIYKPGQTGWLPIVIYKMTFIWSFNIEINDQKRNSETQSVFLFGFLKLPVQKHFLFIFLDNLIRLLKDF